jgi:glycosyltransferase involved in cell wall biosynthesis
VVTHGNRREHGPEIAALEDGITGLTFARGDARSLATCAKRICEDDALRTRMSAAARRMVEDNYSMKGMVRRFAEAVAAASRVRPPR